MLDEAVAKYEELTGRKLNKADPDRLFLSWAVSALLNERANTNYTGNQNIPSRSVGENLDALAELFYLQARPQAKAAVSIVRFTITQVLTKRILVPAGTRVTDDEQALFWETVEDAYIAPGSLSVDVPVRCQTLGTIGNGYEPGTINNLVDEYQYAGDPENIVVSDSGSDLADDAEFYALLRDSMHAFSTAGPSGAYEYHAKSVSNEIADVKACSPSPIFSCNRPVYTRNGAKFTFIGGYKIDTRTLKVSRGNVVGQWNVDYVYTRMDSPPPASYRPYTGEIAITLKDGGAFADADDIDISYAREIGGQVYVYALMADGTPASEVVKEEIYKACSADDVRPLTDYVEVRDPAAADYDIDVSYYIPRESPNGGEAIEAAVANAVSDYIAWQAGAMGRDINPSVLIEYLMNAGVKRVVVRSPEYRVLSDGSDWSVPEYARVGTVNVSNGGVEEW